MWQLGRKECTLLRESKWTIVHSMRSSIVENHPNFFNLLVRSYSLPRTHQRLQLIHLDGCQFLSQTLSNTLYFEDWIHYITDLLSVTKVFCALLLIEIFAVFVVVGWSGLVYSVTLSLTKTDPTKLEVKLDPLIASVSCSPSPALVVKNGSYEIYSMFQELNLHQSKSSVINGARRAWWWAWWFRRNKIRHSESS